MTHFSSTAVRAGRELRVLRAVQRGIDITGMSVPEMRELTVAILQNKIVDHSFFQQLTTELQKVIGTCEVGDVAFFADVFNRRKEFDPVLFSRMVDRLLPIITKASNGDLVRILFAFTTAHFRDDRFFFVFNDEFLRRTSRGVAPTYAPWTAQELYVVMHCFAKLRCLQLKVIRRWLKLVLALDIRKLEPKIVVSFAQALDEVGVWCPPLHKRLREAALRWPPKRVGDVTRAMYLGYSFVGFTAPRFLLFALRHLPADPDAPLTSRAWGRVHLALAACHLTPPLGGGVGDSPRAAAGPIKATAACEKRVEAAPSQQADGLPLREASLGMLQYLAMEFAKQERQAELTSGLAAEVHEALEASGMAKNTAEEMEVGPYLVDLILINVKR